MEEGGYGRCTWLSCRALTGWLLRLKWVRGFGVHDEAVKVLGSAWGWGAVVGHVALRFGRGGESAQMRYLETMACCLKEFCSGKALK